jgi:methionyl-tRNA formyltransferase
MKLVILTTDTLHHAYFIREILRSFPIEHVFVETNKFSPPFDTHHPFEEEREQYEMNIFFKGKETSIRNIADTTIVSSVNEFSTAQRIMETHPDIIIVFGTGKIKKHIIDICPNGFINLHGGGPEEYRGLDSHLWAIYHEDFVNLITTMHCLNETLDDGEIILQASIPLRKGMRIYELRRYNTDVCIKLSISALDMFSRFGIFISRPQQKKGRYYSAMPTALKSVCVNTFHKHTDNIS